MSSVGRLSGRNALITGSSRGIGFAIAQAYAREGANVFLTATNEDRLAVAKESLSSFGVKVGFCSGDLSDPAAIQTIFDKAVAWSGGLDVVVNNAGIYIGRPFTEYTLPEFDRVMQVNVYAVFQLTQLAVTHMRERRGEVNSRSGNGKIINISSTAGKWESPNQSAYNTSKHAVVGLSKCVALETATDGINVNTICPGMVETDMIQEFDVHAKALGITVDELQEQMSKTRIPIGRFLVPEEVSHIAVYLGSSESDGMTGQTITISGGMRMG